MHDVDSVISSVSGKQNYMESLEKITGNIMFIELELFKNRMSRISELETVLKDALNIMKISFKSDEFNTIYNTYMTQSDLINIKNNCTEMKTRKLSKKAKKQGKKPKPPIEIVSENYKPQNIIKTEWWKSIKHLEKNANKLIEELGIDKNTPSYTNLKKIYSDHPEYRELKYYYGIFIENEKQFESLVNIYKFSNSIIEIMLTPMYDIKKTINSNWSKIERIFKSNAFANTEYAKAENIINMLEQFIIAKYRSNITGSQKHYMKLFMEIVGDEAIASSDGARFMEIMDSIDTDKLNKKDNVYKFATAAKTAMKKIAEMKNDNNPQTTDELIRDLTKLFDNTEQSKEQLQLEDTTTENADILSDI